MVADLSWGIHLSDSQVWQREAITVEVSVQTSNKFSRLQAGKLNVVGAKVVALPLRLEKEESEENYQLSLRWRVTPYSSGQQTIQLPEIRYSLNGANRVKWQAPAQIINVQALPPYFSPTLPVGEVRIASYMEPKGVLTPDTLAYWHITLQSNHVTPEQFPPLLKQIKSNIDFDRFPATLSVKPSFESGNFQQNYLIPIKPKNNGVLDLPTLEWHWFDPASGRLNKQEYHPPSPFVLSKLWQVVIGSVLLIFGSTVLYRISRFSYRAYQRWISKQRLRQALKHPKNTQEIRDAMMSCAITHHWPVIFSVKQWLVNWESVYGKNESLRKAIQKYEANCFGKKF